MQKRYRIYRIMHPGGQTIKGTKALILPKSLLDDANWFESMDLAEKCLAIIFAGELKAGQIFTIMPVYTNEAF